MVSFWRENMGPAMLPSLALPKVGQPAMASRRLMLSIIAASGRLLMGEDSLLIDRGGLREEREASKIHIHPVHNGSCGSSEASTSTATLNVCSPLPRITPRMGLTSL